MCGICGIKRKNEAAVIDEQILIAMNRSIAHRGPDDEGIYIDRGVGIASRRLSIIDLSSGHQPIHNEDSSIWIVFNGEIYNYKQIRQELEQKGHRFYTNTDTEVIVHLYEERGSLCVAQLRGMFAFSIWDSAKKTLFLARDRLGQKPLYYYYNQGDLIFASEMKAILQSREIDRGLDYQAFDSYVTFGYIPSPRSIFKQVKKLPPASTLEWRGGEIKIGSYWEIDYTQKTTLKEGQIRAKLEDLIQESINLHLISDVPLGVFLSGGIDSSSLVALMHKQNIDGIKTFAMGFGLPQYDELKYARIVAKKFNTEHYEFKSGPESLDILPRLIWFCDEPFADTSIVPTYLLSNNSKKFITVAISGDGGDELFAGYPWTHRFQFIKYYNSLPSSLRRIIYRLLISDPLLAQNSTGYLNKARRFLLDASVPLGESFFRRTSINAPAKELLYSERTKDCLSGFNAAAIQGEYFQRASVAEEAERMLYIDTKMYLPEDCLVKVDRMSMANSQEVRPFLLDHKLVEFAATIPFNLKLRGLTSKYIFKKTVSSLLPRRILRQRKQGFGMPIGPWFKKDLKSLIERVLLDEKSLNRGFFNPTAVRNMLEGQEKGKKDYSQIIWAIFIFEIWCRIFLDFSPADHRDIRFSDLT